MSVTVPTAPYSVAFCAGRVDGLIAAATHKPRDAEGSLAQRLDVHPHDRRTYLDAYEEAYDRVANRLNRTATTAAQGV